MSDPTPLGEAPCLRQLIEQWRERARLEREAGENQDQRLIDLADHGADTYDICISELEVLLVAEGAARRHTEVAPVSTQMCPAKYGGFLCTLAIGHTGHHLAHGTNGHVYHGWPNA